jgi:nucleoside-diphosphate-sugar epimerase
MKKKSKDKEKSVKNRFSSKVLVTGGGGFLGGAICKILIERGNCVRSFSRGFYPALESMGIEQINGDLSDVKAVDRACSGMDLVFHVAAKPGVWGDYSDYFRTNVIGTQNIITGCLNHQIPKLVYTSSPSVVFNGTDMEGVDESASYPSRFHAHYPETKALAERCVIQAVQKGLKAIILRPHLIWGPHDNHLVPRIIRRARQLVRVGNGMNRVDTTYIDNAAEAHILAADRLEENPGLSGNVYFISQGEPVLLWEMVNHILKAAGLGPVTRSVSHRMAWIIGAILEFAYKKFSLVHEPPITRFVADELAMSHWFDISAAQRDLGYNPKVSTGEGLKRLEDWLSQGSSCFKRASV